MASDLPRKPPTEVLRLLRREVGFGCPVDECGSPYLTWHHFDPEWRVEHHHRPEGMIALCREHHDKAGGGAFTNDQLREMKRTGSKDKVGGRFDWMRQKILGVAGGSFGFETPVLVQYGQENLIWFERDENGLMLLNVKMPKGTGTDAERTSIEQNFWTVGGDPEDITSPPSGRLLDIRYKGGDFLRVEFFVAETWDAFRKRYPVVVMHEDRLRKEIPLTIAEVTMGVAGTPLDFGPTESRIRGNLIVGHLSIRGNVMFHIEP